MDYDLTAARARRAIGAVAGLAVIGALVLGVSSFVCKGARGEPSLAASVIGGAGLSMRLLTGADAMVDSPLAPSAIAEDLAVEVGASADGDVRLPAWFVEEVGPFEGRPGLLATADCAVVGYSSLRPAEEELALLSAEFSQRGWVGYEGGAPGVATFVKKGGVCSWMMVSCSWVGDATSVVLRVRKAE